MSGKGDSPRPMDKKKYDENYERIFKEKGGENNVQHERSEVKSDK